MKNIISLPECTQLLAAGAVGVIPTDTIYGIVCQALNQDSVARLYRLKHRSPTKPFIILISQIDDLKLFNVALDDKIRAVVDRYWPGPVSIILDCHDEQYGYLHRSTQSLAFRLPNNPELLELISVTGPLVAPSANPEGQPPSHDIEQAWNYFGESVDFYAKGPVNTKPSTILRVSKSGAITIVRD